MTDKSPCRYVNKAHISAWRMGLEAHRNGVPRSRCPYDLYAIAVVGKGRHIPTGERGFAKAWLAGWDHGGKGGNP